MAIDGATLDYFLNTMLALSTVCPTPLNFTIQSLAWEDG